MHGGGCAWQGHMHSKGGMCGKGDAWQGACMEGGMCGRGACMPPPHTHNEIWSVNVWAVRILLECILVTYLHVQ